jgi:hypothetical protein
MAKRISVLEDNSAKVAINLATRLQQVMTWDSYDFMIDERGDYNNYYCSEGVHQKHTRRLSNFSVPLNKALHTGMGNSEAINVYRLVLLFKDQGVCEYPSSLGATPDIVMDEYYHPFFDMSEMNMNEAKWIRERHVKVFGDD